ncbi:MAG: GIY-YIG nuclease family protein [Chitinophagaceae bacterium]|nr:GIY-YIG nuclease family protein [Chitinophagaceae bacterium]
MQTSVHQYFVYITTNPGKSTLYVGVTNNLAERINEHWGNRGRPESFAGKYFCYHLIYFEVFHISSLPSPGKRKSKMERRKEVLLIQTQIRWHFLKKICGQPLY